MALKRVLGPADAAWLVAGNMIGAGIFYTPGLVAGRLPGFAWPMAAWVLGGLFALCGALIYGELGARLPRAGGDYQYLSRAFGPLWGFLTGWAAMMLTFSAAAAVAALVAHDYLTRALPALGGLPGFIVAPLFVVLLTAANARGVRVGGRATVAFTAVPVLGLVALFGYGLAAGRVAVRVPPAAAPEEPWPLALAGAMVFVYFTYSGWNAAAYLAGEIRDAGRELARGLVWGTALVMVLYLAVNAVMLVVVPQDAFRGSTTAGAQTARLLLGPGAERALSLLIALAVLGSANVTLMAGARVYYAMARDGLAPAALGRENAAGVPATALWAGGAWTVLMSLTGRVGALLDWAGLAILMLSSLAVAALFVLRRRDGPAGYRCPGYPFTPLVYLAGSLAIAVMSAWSQPRWALYGLLVVAAGVPVYFIARRAFHVTSSSPGGRGTPAHP